MDTGKGGMDCVGAGTSTNGGDGFIDRSKVRILLCDNDSSSSEEVYTLLMKCSYQVTSVRSARQVIDALNAEGLDIDIILAEVDLPMKKGMKMLKYITRHKDLRRIPVIMMSAQDEVSTVVNCLRFGAADYLVKPLRSNELLTLWTHMWRRRRMLGLAEKGILNYELDPVASDHSDANTNSTTLFSDETNENSRKNNDPETVTSTHMDNEVTPAAISVAVPGPLPQNPQEYRPAVPGITDRRRAGQFSAGPKKSELKVGESSAFFTYVKSSPVKSIAQSVPVPRIEESGLKIDVQGCGQQAVTDTQLQENGETWESYSQGDDFRSSASVPDSLSVERSCTPPGSREYPQLNHNEKNLHHMLGYQRNEQQPHASGLQTQNLYSYYMHGVMNQVMMPPSTHLYQKNMHELQSQAASGMMSQYNHHPQHTPHIPGMPPFSYYPAGMCLQPGQMPSTNSWQQTFGNPSSAEAKTNKVDRREAALIKFRQKRKERCFDKKIRYVNRKKLAERRPRVRGQFVRKLNGINVDLNGLPSGTDFEDEEEDDVELALRDCSPEDEAP
ncbi:Two-component response regulator-like APRR1 [Linum perenne]